MGWVSCWRCLIAAVVGDECEWGCGGGGTRGCSAYCEGVGKDFLNGLVDAADVQTRIVEGGGGGTAYLLMSTPLSFNAFKQRFSLFRAARSRRLSMARLILLKKGLGCGN